MGALSATACRRWRCATWHTRFKRRSGPRWLSRRYDPRFGIPSHPIGDRLDVGPLLEECSDFAGELAILVIGAAVEPIGRSLIAAPRVLPARAGLRHESCLLGMAKCALQPPPSLTQITSQERRVG